MSYNWPVSKQFLKDVKEIIDETECKCCDEGFHGQGYCDAIEDLKYACSLSTIALEQHFANHLGEMLYGSYDEGYDEALNDVMNSISKMLNEEDWSF